MSPVGRFVNRPYNIPQSTSLTAPFRQGGHFAKPQSPYGRQLLSKGALDAGSSSVRRLVGASSARPKAFPSQGKGDHVVVDEVNCVQ